MRFIHPILQFFLVVYKTLMRSHEARWTSFGVVLGAIIGLAIGGVGIAARGGASGISAIVVVGLFAGLGALVGSRFGIWLDQRLIRSAPPNG